MSKFYEEDAFLKIRDAQVVFRTKRSKLIAVKETNLDIKKGEIFGIVGESGSGKTTLGRAIVGVQPLKDGAIFMENEIIAGKSSSLYLLNKQISAKLADMKAKMNTTTLYLNEFLTIVKKIYKENPNLKNVTKESFIKNFKAGQVDFMDSVFLTNLKQINRIIVNQERIIRFITNISQSIEEISIKLEKTILIKQKQVKECILELKEILDEIYEIAHPIVTMRKKWEEDEIDIKVIFIKILKKLNKIIEKHKAFLIKLDETIGFQYENQALSAPLKKRDSFLGFYYKKIYIKRDAFSVECKKQIELLKGTSDFEKNLDYIKYNEFIRNFWSTNSMNIKMCANILKKLKENQVDFLKLQAMLSTLNNTDFENDLKILVNNPKDITPKKLKEISKTFENINRIIHNNIVKDRELIDEYKKWKNIEFDLTTEELENLEEFIEFLEMPSIDEIVKSSYLFKGHTKKERRNNRKNVQMIFQDPASSLNDRMAVEEIIGEGLENFPELYKGLEAKEMYVMDYNQKNSDHKITIGDVKNQDVKKHLILNALTSVGLIPEHLSRYPHEFSGGQRQRIGIARSLVMKPKVIVADEPISALDVSIRAQVLNLFKKFKEDLGITFVFVAHDLSVVRFIADRIAVIYRGQIVEMAEANELFENPMHPYTRSLLTAIPIPEPELAKKSKNILYKPEKEHSDYLFDLPRFIEVMPGHFVFANKRELKELKKNHNN